MVGMDIMLLQYSVHDAADFRIVDMVVIRKQVVSDVVVKPAENEIGNRTERMHVVGAAHLIHQPGGSDISRFVGGRIRGCFNVMRHQEGHEQEDRLCQVHQQESGQHGHIYLGGVQ